MSLLKRNIYRTLFLEYLGKTALKIVNAFSFWYSFTHITIPLGLHTRPPSIAHSHVQHDQSSHSSWHSYFLRLKTAADAHNHFRLSNLSETSRCVTSFITPYEKEANDLTTKQNILRKHKELGLTIVHFDNRDQNGPFNDWGDQKHTLCMNQILSKHFLIVKV